MEQPSSRHNTSAPTPKAAQPDADATTAQGTDPGFDHCHPEFCPSLPADNINNPPENMMRRFFINLLLVAAALAVFFIAINFIAVFLTPFIPFSWERKLVGNAGFETQLDTRGKAREAALRSLEAKLSAAANLPEGMQVTVHYNPAGIKNAFATFGGNIIVFEGLLDLVQSEDGLAMVLAHEMMHIRHRDSIQGLMRGLGLMLLSVGMNSNMLDKVVTLGMSGYSREQEMRADLDAVAILGQVYGHAGGAEEFFTSLAETMTGSIPELSKIRSSGITSIGSTHPDTIIRLKAVHEEVQKLGIPSTGSLTPLPDALDRNMVFFDDAALQLQ